MAVKRKAPRLATSPAMEDCFIRAARAAASLHDLALLMEAVTADLGFRHYALIHHADLRGSPPGRVNIKRYPDDIAARIIDEAGYRRDPVKVGMGGIRLRSHRREHPGREDEDAPPAPRAEIGRAHVGTPVTNAHLVCRL